MRWSIEKRISTGFAIALLVLSLIGGLAYWSTTQLIGTAHWVDHTHTMLDVDHFKRFNDTFGHEAGDVVLLGQFLQSMIRSSDIACRYGGEEFMLLLPEASLEITQQRAEQIRSGVKHLTLEYRRQALGAVTLSLGVATFPQHGNTVEAVTRAADAALYQAKNQGRNQVVIAV